MARGEEGVNFFHRRHFCSALYENFLTYMCKELVTWIFTWHRILLTVCLVLVFSCVSRTLTALCCTELLVLISACMDRRLLATQLPLKQKNPAFPAKQTRLGRCNYHWPHTLKFILPRIINCILHLIKWRSYIEQSLLLASAWRVEWTWDHFGSWTPHHWTKNGPLCNLLWFTQQTGIITSDAFNFAVRWHIYGVLTANSLYLLL